MFTFRCFVAPLSVAVGVVLTGCAGVAPQDATPAASAAPAPAAPMAAGPVWRSLVGANLDGWIQKGGKAKYRVESGGIVGTTAPNTPNSFLCTARDYTNFILELEFKVDPGLNSGVQIRSHAYDKPTPNRMAGQNREGAGEWVHGYQVEIDTSARAWSGGLYEEGRRGWLVNLTNNPAARAAFKQNEWNKYRIEAVRRFPQDRHQWGAGGEPQGCPGCGRLHRPAGAWSGKAHQQSPGPLSQRAHPGTALRVLQAEKSTNFRRCRWCWARRQLSSHDRKII